MNLPLEDKKEKEKRIRCAITIMYFFFLVFLGNYRFEKEVVASFTNFIILFKLLKWRCVEAPENFWQRARSKYMTK
jgi:hypothetical protein